jgi:hypothetical protein
VGGKRNCGFAACKCNSSFCVDLFCTENSLDNLQLGHQYGARSHGRTDRPLSYLPPQLTRFAAHVENAADLVPPTKTRQPQRASIKESLSAIVNLSSFIRPSPNSHSWLSSSHPLRRGVAEFRKHLFPNIPTLWLYMSRCMHREQRAKWTALLIAYSGIARFRGHRAGLTCEWLAARLLCFPPHCEAAHVLFCT